MLAGETLFRWRVEASRHAKAYWEHDRTPPDPQRRSEREVLARRRTAIPRAGWSGSARAVRILGSACVRHLLIGVPPISGGGVRPVSASVRLRQIDGRACHGPPLPRKLHPR